MSELKRRRNRCQYCNTLYFSGYGVRGLCDECMPAWLEVAELQLSGIIAGAEEVTA